MNYIDFKKYKRFFAFGCSFTSHVYPTWANVISSEMPNAEFYNLGLSGAGNLFINIRIAEANSRFNFCDTDLIMVMYSTFYREDRWYNGKWHLGGNIYHNGYYEDSFVEKYADPTGYVIRDLALIETSTRYLKSLPCDSHVMMAAGWNAERKSGNFGGDIEEQAFKVYAKTLEIFPPPLLDLEFNGTWSSQVSYVKDDGSLVNDPHPRPNRYKEYLKKIKLPLTKLSENYTNAVEEKLQFCKTSRDFERLFPEETAARDLAYRLMF